MKYFESCKTMDDLRKLYRKLAMENHPDRGGSTEIMKEINAEYDMAFDAMKKQHNAQASATGARTINEAP